MTGLQDGRERAVSLALWSGAALLLLLPAVAMRFTREVAWDAAAFAVFGVMLALACGAFEVARRVMRGRAVRVAAGLAIAAAFLLVWAELAVGIVGAG